MMATKNPFQGDDVDPFSGVRDESGAIKRETGNVSKPAPAAKQNFGQAFAAARRAGKDDFTWNGKRYTTEMAKPAAKPAAKSAPADTRRPGPTRERAADTAPMARKSDASTSRGVRAAEPAPRATTQPAAKTPARSGVQARADADRAARDARYEFGRQRKAEKATAKTESDKASAQRLRDDPKQKELRAAREAREKMSPAERSAARGQRLKEFFGAPKKMATGGSVSARADGLAKRGKTKCKII
jgi:hypothetical protein